MLLVGCRDILRTWRKLGHLGCNLTGTDAKERPEEWGSRGEMTFPEPLLLDWRRLPGVEIGLGQLPEDVRT